mgnify:CR=1 FL=1
MKDYIDLYDCILKPVIEREKRFKEKIQMRYEIENLYLEEKKDGSEKNEDQWNDPKSLTVHSTAVVRSGYSSSTYSLQ